MDEKNTQYEGLLYRTRFYGEDRPDRTGVGTRSLFGERLKYDLRGGAIPLITTKKVFVRGVIEELLWMLRGETNVKPLQEKGVHIWDEWADAQGGLGPVYGAQWRAWTGFGYDNWTGADEFDQIAALVDGLRNDPYSRRHIVSAWNVGDLSLMALAPCHMMFQCYVTTDGHLDMQVYQRSADLFLGVPFNLASYAFLTHMLAQQTGLIARYLTWVGGDVHVYTNHFEQVDEQLSREPRPFPTLALRKADSIDSYTYEDFKIIGYDPYPAITAPVAV